jgi:hypothetical protein
MDKRTFFNNLDKQLGLKYKLTSDQINTIRSFYLGDKKTRKEIAEWCAVKLTQPHHGSHGKNKKDSLSRRMAKPHYQTLLNFIASCSEVAWNDITQKTEYDK